MLVPNEGKFGVRKSVKGAFHRQSNADCALPSSVGLQSFRGCDLRQPVLAGSPVCGQFRPGSAPKRVGMHTRLKFTARGGGFAFRPAAPPLPLTAQTMTQMLQSTRTNWAPVTDQQPPFPQHRLYPSNHPRLLNAAFYHMNNLII